MLLMHERINKNNTAIASAYFNHHTSCLLYTTTMCARMIKMMKKLILCNTWDEFVSDMYFYMTTPTTTKTVMIRCVEGILVEWLWERKIYLSLNF